MGGGFCRNAITPGTEKNRRGRSWSMNWSAESARSSRGFSFTNTKDWLPPPTTKAMVLSTAGCAFTMSLMAVVWWTM